MFNFNFDINKLLCTYPNESNYQNNETNPFTNENEVMPFPSNDHSFNSRDGPFYPSPNFNDLTNNDVNRYFNINNNNDQDGPLSAINEVQNNHNNHSITNRVKIKIFEIKKVNKNLGRKRKNDSQINLNNDKTHTKYGDDNIRTKIMRQLYEHSLKYLNNSFKSSQNPVIKKQKLLKINTSFIIFSDKEKNLNLLGTKLKIICSYEISKKYKNKDKYHNKKTIDIILDQNDENINYFLNLDVEDILDIYAGKNEDEIIKNFPTVDDDISIFKNEGDDDFYTEKYKFIAKNFKKMIDDIIPRDKKKKNISLNEEI